MASKSIQKHKFSCSNMLLFLFYFNLVKLAATWEAGKMFATYKSPHLLSAG